MKRLALGYLVLVLVASVAISVDPMGWLNSDAGKPSPPAAPQAVAEAPSAATALRTDGVDLEATTAAILAELSGRAAPASPPVADDALQAMSLAALSGLRNRAAPAGASRSTAATLQGIVTQALREGQSDAYIDALVNEAAGKGTLAVPGMLVTPEGRVDTAVLLATLVARAQEVDLGEGDAADPGAEAAFAALPAQPSGDLVHTVQPGDSLGALALRFYGDAARYSVIFDANRRILTAPDRIAVGQRLVIPRIAGL
jgi:nucleoid-associated protein YgaU